MPLNIVLEQCCHVYKDGCEKPIAYASRTITQTVKNYAQRDREALSIVFGIKKFNLYLYGCVIFPSKHQHRVLEMLRESHPGINKMKLLARSYCWWPGIDQDKQKHAKSCAACLSVAPTPAVSSLHPWLWPIKPWQRIHVDFAGPLEDISIFSSWIHILSGRKFMRQLVHRPVELLKYNVQYFLYLHCQSS